MDKLNITTNDLIAYVGTYVQMTKVKYCCIILLILLCNLLLCQRVFTGWLLITLSGAHVGLALYVTMQILLTVQSIRRLSATKTHQEITRCVAEVFERLEREGKL